MRKLYLLGLLVMAPSVWAESSAHIQNIIEERGYEYYGFGKPTSLASGTYIVPAYSRSADDNAYQSTLVAIKDKELTPIEQPKTAGNGGYIQLMDLNFDEIEDIVSCAYLEDRLLVRVFLNNGKDIFTQIYEGSSASRPNYFEHYDYDASKPIKIKGLVLYENPHQLGYGLVFIPELYYYDGHKYVHHTEYYKKTKNRNGRND